MVIEGAVGGMILQLHLSDGRQDTDEKLRCTLRKVPFIIDRFETNWQCLWHLCLYDVWCFSYIIPTEGQKETKNFFEPQVKFISLLAPNKSNISSAPQGYVEMVTGVEGMPCRRLLQHTPANRALVYLSQGERNRAEGCMALG